MAVFPSGLRARGLDIASGELIRLLEDHALPDYYWSSRVVKAHDGSVAVVGGAIENGVSRALNWAVYFCDFGMYQNPLPSGQSTFASDANSVYKKSSLESIRQVGQESFHETLVNDALMASSEIIALRQDLIAFLHRQGLSLGAALWERYVWGRSYASTRCSPPGAKRFPYVLLAPLLPALMVSRVTANVLKKRRRLGKFLVALPAIMILMSSWGLGEMVGYFTGKAH